jgi:uncharacterized NAD-dependent epimerase/dehydratase family protein
MSSKTANAAIRYTPARVAAVYDTSRVGLTAQQVLGFGGDIPVVDTLADGIRHGATAVLVGIAPAGGRLPETWRALVGDAARAGLDVWSGLHTYLADDPAIAAAARAGHARIVDLRRAPDDLTVATGRVREVDATVVLTVGSDCNIGKMTTQLQLRDALRGAGVRVAFAATGQTGILVEGWGIAVDAVVGDYIAGAAERLVMQAAEHADVVLVEGQGSIIHPSYSGVTYGLLHGSLPHAMVLCHQPSRQSIANHPWVPLPSLPDLVRMHEAATAPLRPAPVVGIALNTVDLDHVAAMQAVEHAASATGLPVTDPVRFDPAPLVEAVRRFDAGRRSPTRGDAG